MLILCQSHRDPIQIPRASWDHCWMSQIIPISIPHHSRINPTSIPLSLSQIDPIKVPHRSHKFYPTSFPDRSHIDPTKIPHRCGIDVGSEIPVPESYTLVTQSHIDPKFSEFNPTSIPHLSHTVGSFWDRCGTFSSWWDQCGIISFSQCLKHSKPMALARI
jgi:hypothetical protein